MQEGEACATAVPHQVGCGRADERSVFKCFMCFRLVFQVFHLNVAKVDLGCCICCKLYVWCEPMFQEFQTFVSNVLSGCFKTRFWCYTCCNGYTRMFQAYVSSVSSVFIFMLQMFHLDVLKVDRVLHVVVCLLLLVCRLVHVSGLQMPSRCTSAGGAGGRGS
jgi:hypothetical protein